MTPLKKGNVQKSVAEHMFCMLRYKQILCQLSNTGIRPEKEHNKALY
jgi:hypothetical protein